jgi:hypothetical protein
VLAAVYLAAFSVLPAAWMTRNRHVSGLATVSSSVNVNLLFQWGAAIAATDMASHWDRLTAVQSQTGFRAPLHRIRHTLLAEAFDLARREGVEPLMLNSAQQSPYLGRVASRLIRAHPVALAELMISAIAEMHLFEPALIAADFGVNPRTALMFVPLTLASLAFALTGLAVLWKSNRDLTLLLAATILYFTVTSAIPEPDIRFDAAFAPEYAIALAAGLAYSLRALRASRRATSGPS